MLIQRLRIAEKFGVQYAGLTSSKELVAKSQDKLRSEGQLLGDAYDFLGVTPDDPTDLIKDVYRKKAMYYHPDKKGGTDEKFKRITEAFERIIRSREPANGAK